MTELFPESKVTRPPLRYHGGKFRIAPWIIEHMPAHKVYCEPFGGAAGVLLRKPRSKIEVYNDLDLQVIGFFRLLRNQKLTQELARQVALTPFSREEFELAYLPADDPIEAARRFVARCYFGYGSSSVDPSDSNGFRSRDVLSGKSYAVEWSGIPSAIVVAAERFRGVTIEQLDFRLLIPKIDTTDTVFYCDPPYPQSTRDNGGKGYCHEMTDEDHRQLAWLLHRVSGRVMVSGYRCDLYDRLFGDWRRVEKSTTAAGHRGAVQRTESLWMNFDPTEQIKP